MPCPRRNSDTDLVATAFIRTIKDSLRRMTGGSDAPPAPKSLIYALCEEYRHLDLWAAYHAYRLDPRARNWRRLRGRNVPWQREQTVENLLHRLCPWNAKRTPDPSTVGLALVTASFAAAGPFKKKR
jgi:hypothetical protein